MCTELLLLLVTYDKLVRTYHNLNAVTDECTKHNPHYAKFPHRPANVAQITLKRHATSNTIVVNLASQLLLGAIFS